MLCGRARAAGRWGQRVGSSPSGRGRGLCRCTRPAPTRPTFLRPPPAPPCPRGPPPSISPPPGWPLLHDHCTPNVWAVPSQHHTRRGNWFVSDAGGSLTLTPTSSGVLIITEPDQQEAGQGENQSPRLWIWCSLFPKRAPNPQEPCKHRDKNMQERTHKDMDHRQHGSHQERFAHAATRQHGLPGGSSQLLSPPLRPGPAGAGHSGEGLGDVGGCWSRRGTPAGVLQRRGRGSRPSRLSEQGWGCGEVPTYPQGTPNSSHVYPKRAWC